MARITNKLYSATRNTISATTGFRLIHEPTRRVIPLRTLYTSQ